MEGMVCEYRNSGYLSADSDSDAYHIPNPFHVTEGIYDLLCDGIGIFDGASVYFINDRGDPLQDTICGVYRMQFFIPDRSDSVQEKRI